MAEYCSSIRIEVLPLGSDPWTQTNVDPVEAPYVAASSIMLDFGERMADEMEVDWGSQSQDSLPVLAKATVVRGREGNVATIRWSRILEHDDVDAARRYQMDHALAISGATVRAAISYSDQRGAAADPARITGRAHISASTGRIPNGSSTRFDYTMRWQVDGGGA